MAPRPPLTGLSLFAGVAMLDEGVRAGFDMLGIDYRCVGYVERDAYAASALVARMESAALDQAPIWDDITTFDGRCWRGVVDCIVAGFPCQDISVAGSRAGLDGKRSGLFYEVLRVAADCGARFIFLENVAGIVSAGAAVVDQTEGELSERAAARVVGELADRGWDAEWLHLRASDVGAAQKRERWFCLAWRMADAELPEWRAQRVGGDRQRQGNDGERQADGGAGVAGSILADAVRPGRQQNTGSASRDESPHEGRCAQHYNQLVCSDAALAYTESFIGGERIGQRQRTTAAARHKPRLEGCSEALADATWVPSWQRTGRERILNGGAQLDNTESERWREGWTGHAGQQGRCAAAEHSGELANTERARLQERRCERSDVDSQCPAVERDSGEIFAPGPGDIDGWNRVIADGEFDYRAPAIKPGVCRVVNGLAYRVDQYRADRLRCGGNGVVAAQAAAALVELVRRSLTEP